ncbi:hypothetical protein [Polluticoccus soli]|uniref:hypothetical protein n=1 Tax=Polluticoccus soli TaxID=3034150 RepID=UPI0023E1F52E|nr:hypothetical protein [Flavipsychrobacter sp. JY13-12]
MRWIYLVLLVLIFLLERCYGQANSEEIAVGRILICLQNGQQSQYTSLFPTFDTLCTTLREYKDENQNEMRKVMRMQRDSQQLKQFDPVYNTQISDDFDRIRAKGHDSGLHWTDMVMARYELEKMMLPRELIGLPKIMPLRLQGYIFVEDMLTRRRYVVGVRDVFTFKDKWYGGRLVNVFEADNIDEYLEKFAQERRIEKERLLNEMYGVAEVAETTPVAKPAPDPLAQQQDDDDEQEKEKPTREIVERKYYKGTFDETPVELYIRGMKGPCPETVCTWEAMYRFQDMDEFIKLEVFKGPDGIWHFNEEPEVGAMELKLQGDKFTGGWMSLKDKTEYEVTLTEQKEVRGKKLMQMDTILENDLFSN